MLKQVVVIDDDPINNLICEKLLQYSGKVEKWQSFLLPEEALGWLVALEPSAYPELILLDINMPLMDGWSFLNALAHHLPGQAIHIVILTSSISADDLTRTTAHPGLSGYLSKPLTLEKLTPLLASISETETPTPL